MDYVGDYWDDKTMLEIEALLKEYEDLFPQKNSDLNGIKCHVGEVKIDLKPNARLVKHR